jgi:LAO/AO transport system kinase
MKESTPKVVKGIAQPKSINLASIRKIKRKRKELGVDVMVKGILNGDRVMLSQAITLIESTKAIHQAKAQQIIEACLPHTGSSFRLGITGTPGVGKSTFIESFGQEVIEKGKKVAVLAIDPTSQISKGSILGDKTRMLHLSTHPKAFIRPSPAGRSLGGVARTTRETIILCEAAGFDFIIIETVGVGQSEVAVHSMVDFFLLLLLAGAGDELQGIKKGIVEMADLIAINKADGDNLKKAKLARREYRNALHILPPKPSGWIPQATICSGISKLGMDEIWQLLQDFYHKTSESQYFQQHRQNQSKFWLHEAIQNQLKALFYDNPSMKNQISTVERAVLDGKISPFIGAEKLIRQWIEKGNQSQNESEV